MNAPPSGGGAVRKEEASESKHSRALSKPLPPNWQPLGLVVRGLLADRPASRRSRLDP